MLNELTSELNTRGAVFVKPVDISMLSLKENRGYSVGILIAIALSPNYISDVFKSRDKIVDKTIFTKTEKNVDNLGEWAANFIISKGYKAFAQSERNLLKNGFYNELTKSTPLPHKKIATIGGLGWIGKNNLLSTQQYGSALCMCSVLVNAPIHTENMPIIMSKCGECTICKKICPTGAIHGSTWDIDTHRDRIIDVNKCIGCLKCLSNCPWTQKYIKSSMK